MSDTARPREKNKIQRSAPDALARPRPAEVISIAEARRRRQNAEARERLKQAVAKMEAELEKQKAAVQTFREANGRLAQSVRNLGEDMDAYAENLERIKLKPLRGKARRLARIAEGWSKD